CNALRADDYRVDPAAAGVTVRHIEPPHFDRRRDANFQRAATLIALVVTLVANIAGIAWGAAKLSSSVERLDDIVRPLAAKVEQNTNDISVLKDRANRGRTPDER
ncbi:MAG TPA: hypothetical protein VKA60_27665, partial [Blastocatellia bacterium]|nr:hypothetical protein [Blastocatellia bacterium]